MKIQSHSFGTLFVVLAIAGLAVFMYSCATMKNEDRANDASPTESLEQASSAKEEAAVQLPHPSDVIPDFPEVGWTMKREEVLAVLESEGYFPERMVPTQVAWEGDFDGLDGRGMISMKEPGGVVLIGVEIPIPETEPDLADTWEKRLLEAYGPNQGEGEDKSWAIEGSTVLHFTQTSAPGVRLEWRRESL